MKKKSASNGSISIGSSSDTASRGLPACRTSLASCFWETWWSWSRPGKEPYTWIDIACRDFNFVEATCWFVFAILVLHRWRKNRRSSLELWYATAFVLFGVSDLIEAWILTSWLLWWKVINLVALYLLRSSVMRRFYPDAKVF